MVLAADYPLLEIFRTIAVISIWVLWVFIVIWTLIDNFMRCDHSGRAKAGWTIFIIFLPLFGVLVYLIARPGDARGAVTTRVNGLPILCLCFILRGALGQNGRMGARLWLTRSSPTTGGSFGSTGDLRAEARLTRF